MNSVELHEAFVWDCDECGRENIARPIVSQLTDEEIEELREQLPGPVVDGMETANGSFAMAVPNQVTCLHCKTQYVTDLPIQYAEDADLDDEYDDDEDL